jgi:3-oxoacyl-[acyl-carrier protein] reductase
MSSHAKPLSGHNILVTGASGAIGAAIVESLASEGARPIIHYRRQREAAEALADRVGGTGVLLQADLSDPAGAARLWDEAQASVGRIHGLVNNAGIRTTIALDGDLSAWQEAWRQELQVNVLAAADLCRSAILHFRAHGGGRIVNMASRAGQRGYVADAIPYGAAKAALNNITKSIARSFGGEGVIAVAIAPGWVRSHMADAYVAQASLAAAVGDIPIGVMAEPAEIAELVTFVMRSSQRSLNGATLDLNGGSYVR